MKKLRFVMILLLCLGAFLCLGAAASAEPAVFDSGECGAEGDNLTWTLYEDGVLVIEGSGEMANYSEGGAPWYEYKDTIETIQVNSGVTGVGHYAFYECSNATKLTMPATVTRIGDWAVHACNSLKTAGPIGGGYDYEFGWTEEIPSRAFDCIGGFFTNTGGLSSVTIPDTIRRIGSYAFSSSQDLLTVTIPFGVTNIETETFYGCNGMTSITIPKSVTNIESRAFCACDGMTDVYFSGTEAEWNAITIGSENESLTNATIHFGLSPEIYTISYDPNGGKEAPASQQKVQTVPLTLSNVRPTKENTDAGTYSVRLDTNDGGHLVSVLRAAATTSYTFKGWNTAADGSGTDYAPGASYTADADVTLYAQWESTTTAAPVTLPELSRDDGIFKGWAESRDAESGVVGEYTPTGNVTLYAIWCRADLVLPAALDTVEAEAFTGGAFTYVFIPETVTRIDGNAFASCPKLAYAQFAGADTAIDASAFSGVTGLTIIAPSGSTAEAFAAAHGFDFMPAA